MFETNDEVRAAIEGVVSKPTLYPEYERKSEDQRRADLVQWYESYGEVNQFYNVYGLDRADAPNPDAYLDRGVFRKQRYAENSAYLPEGSAFPYNYTAVMRDKALFEAFCGWALAGRGGYVRSYGIVDGRGFVGWGVAPLDLLERCEGKKLIFKQAYGCSGEGIVLVQVQGGRLFSGGRFFKWDEFVSTLGASARNVWLVQPFIIQHKALAAFNESSVNTMRMITFNTGERVVSIGRSVLRVGKPGTFVDNCDSGGIEVGVSAEGVVGDWFIDVNNGLKCKCEFAGTKIPFYEEAIDFVKRLHSYVPQVFSIGWDICITPDGPLVIEGNDGWDPYLIQVPLGYELRETWDELVSERHGFFGQV